MVVIKAAITSHPCSLQARIGPSEVSHPCARRIAYILLGHPKTEFPNDVPWRPTVGAAVHAWAEAHFLRHGAGRASPILGSCSGPPAVIAPGCAR